MKMNKLSQTNDEKVLKEKIEGEEYARKMWSLVNKEWFNNFKEEMRSLPKLSEEEVSSRLKELEGKA